jgi:hypothetical protein
MIRTERLLRRAEPGVPRPELQPAASLWWEDLGPRGRLLRRDRYPRADGAD